MKRDPDKVRAWRERAARRRKDKLRAEGASRVRSLGRNRKRQDREWKRAYGSKARVEWVKRQPSVASGKGPCVNAHVEPPGLPSGMGRKPDARWIVPLTDAEHKELHKGVRTFEAKYGISLVAEAEKTDERWRQR